jgi:hypothetical protein
MSGLSHIASTEQIKRRGRSIGRELAGVVQPELSESGAEMQIDLLVRNDYHGHVNYQGRVNYHGQVRFYVEPLSEPFVGKRGRIRTPSR